MQYASMDGIGMSVKNVEGVPDVNMIDIDIPAQNAMDPGYANTESENRCVVNVEEPPYANMVASLPNASPVVDPPIANMTSFGLLVSSAHQR